MIIKIGHIIGYILIFLGISEFIPILASLTFDEYYLILPFLISTAADLLHSPTSNDQSSLIEGIWYFSILS